MTSVFRPGATALITGGASGIGFAFAQLCRSHGMHLALIDVNSSYLSKAKDLLGASSHIERIETYQVDVSQISAWQKLRSDVEEKFGTVDLLMLNAGASFQPKEGKQSWEDIEYFQKASTHPSIQDQFTKPIRPTRPTSSDP
jgi:short-subunit dehydrogenase